MATTSAQRQAAYRHRHLHDENGKGERLSVVLPIHTKRTLERLASCYGVTQRALLERVLLQAEHHVLQKVSKEANGQSDYYDKKLRLPPVTEKQK